MAPVPESSSTPTAQAIADVEAGLAAFKQSEYPRAIALLKPAVLPSNHPLYLKAQMGLAIAYARTGNLQQATELCQALQRHSNPQAREWAQRTLASIAKQQSQAVPAEKPNATGFMPLDAEPEALSDGSSGDRANSAAPSQTTPAERARTSSGFMPLEAKSPAQQNAANLPAVTGSRTVAQPSQSDRSTLSPELPNPSPVRVPEIAETPPSPGYSPQWKEANRAQQWQPLGKRKPSTPTQGLVALALLWLVLKIIPVNEITLGTSTIPLTWTLIEIGVVFILFWEFAFGRVNSMRLLLQQLVTAIALFWLVREVAYQIPNSYHSLLAKLPFLNYTYTLFRRPTITVAICLAICFVSSRWLLDGLLWLIYGMKSFSLKELGQYSSEAGRSLPTYCRNQRVPIPALGILPTDAPFVISYGCLPRLTRIVVSRGLLEHLSEAEIATLYAAEVGHISHLTVPMLSFMTVILQIPYTIYLFASEYGNRQSQPWLESMAIRLDEVSWLRSLNQRLGKVSPNSNQQKRGTPAWAQAVDSALRDIAVLVAAIAYGFYSLFHYLPLWLTRQRVFFSDRVAAELTGNPNAFTRALLKYAIRTASTVQAEGKTSYLLEGFDLITPLGSQQATSLGSLYPHAPLKSLLEWDWTNPYRNWLSLNNTHPPIGDRLHLQALYAKHWKLDSELDFSDSRLPAQRKLILTGAQWRRLLLQGAPFFGLFFGFLFVQLLSWLGYIAGAFNITWLSWLQSDSTVRYGLPLIGFSAGTFLRINPFFPDIPFFGRSRSNESDNLVSLLESPTALPVDAPSVQLTGKLIGRAGVSNYLSQDLQLQTQTGTVRLHALSPWGPIGNLLQRGNFTDLINQEVTVSGWLRRGNVPWVDVETIRAFSGQTSRSQHPVWSTVIASITAIWGILQIAFGGTTY
jgi:Zn-dependent protease with chaperone function